ncbi:YhaN family protein [Niveispirillum sp.]|uniref:YhaN family protein n=1 Tax=Niveispirillum sp. TaxID=1917217 RepID=UPI001B501492|nr:YhaN family protein [Niveispirillum sp.]MBP7337455.1 AAA family ATPase [Niveispirillum sp.]
MRIDRLDLERYGHFDGTSLDLSDPAARLHIVHGRNEAGKSTALSAICDLLFGVPHNSPMGFRHSNTALRIGALLSLADGTRQEVKRRKGSKATLLDADGSTPLPDGLLLPHLCGLDRAAFQRLFGLDHERLRAGGQAMLEAGGDLARTLFQAGSGLSGLDRIVARLTDDADAIGSPHRKQASKPLWQAADAHADATSRMRNEATKAEAWEAAETALATAREQLLAIRAGLADAERERSRLERLRRVRPLLARLEDLAPLLADAGDGPDLPADLADRWRRAESALLTTTRQTERTRAELAAAMEALAAAGPPPPLLSLAAPIEALYQRQGEIAKSRADLPRRRQERTLAQQRLELAARDIGIDADPDRLDTMLPRRPLIAGIRDKAKEHARLTQTLADARRRHDAATRDARQAERQVPAHAPDAALLAEAEAALAAAGRLGEVEPRLDRAERAFKDGADRLAQLAARLGRHRQDPERLAALPLPTQDAVERQRLREQSLENRRQRLADDRRAAEDQGRHLRQSLRELAEGGEVPTPAAIAQARRSRDTLWSDLRPHLDKGTPAPADTVPAFEAALRNADQLADLREREAARVASYIRAQSDLTANAERLEAISGQENSLSVEQEALATEWADLWQATGIDPGGAAEMAAFLTQTGAILSALAQQSQQAESVAGLRDEARLCEGHLRHALSLCGVEAPAGARLPELRVAADAAVARARQAAIAADKAAQALARARADLELAAAEMEEAERALSAWGAGWTADMQAIGLPAHALPAEAEAALRAWEDVGNELRQIRELDHRIAGLEKDIGAYRADADALLAAASDLMPGLDVGAEDAANALYGALREARTTAGRRDALIQGRDRAEKALADAEQAAQDAADAMSDLRRLHRLADGDDVPALVTAAARRRDLRTQEAALLAELHRAGDGQAPEQLRMAVAGLDPDAMAADLSALTARIETAQNDLADTSVKQREAERALEEMRHRAGIGGAAQDAADAAARAATLASRWLRLRAASLLLTQAVERYRTRNEHPLLQRAGSILAAMAASGGNPVMRLKIDYGAGDNPVLVGVRQDGSDAHVEGMSEGLRDQLFLALRIASVEAHVAQSTPLPFIADDLFITSDEARTRAGLLALAELGQATQVVLFTHHEYVVQAGVEALGDAVRVHRLSAG